MNQSREAHRWDQVADKPALLPMTVEETRFDPSVPVWRRVTTGPVTLGGVALPKGAKLVSVADRRRPGPAGVPGADRFDLARLSFHPNISFRGPQSLRVRPG